MDLTRRAVCGLLAAPTVSSAPRALALFAALAAPAARARALPPAERVALPLPSGRSASLSVWAADGPPRGALLFSHGMGAAPDAYAGLLQALHGAGFTIAAPLHVDSLQHADHARYALPQTFGERVADLHAASAYLGARHPGLPLGAVGHSYGALIGWCLGGALPGLGSMRVPAVQAVLAFSSPGVLPMVDRTAGLRSLAVPSLSITGTRDVRAGWFDDWRDHLLAFEQSAQPRGALVVEGGGHELVTEAAGLARVMPVVRDFLDAWVLGQAAARERLAAAVPTPGPGLSLQWRA